MVLHPEVQRKAQEEIDRVIGTDRLPDLGECVVSTISSIAAGCDFLADVYSKDHLPYLDAVLKEVLRWNILTPNAVPRRLMEDDEYEGG